MNPPASRPRLFDLFAPARLGKDVEKLIGLSLVAAALTSTFLPVIQHRLAGVLPPTGPDDSERQWQQLLALGKEGHPLPFALLGLVLAGVVAFFAIQVGLGLKQMREPKKRLFPPEEDPTRMTPPWGLLDFVLVFLFQQIAPKFLVLAFLLLGGGPGLAIDGQPRVAFTAERRVSFGAASGVASVTSTSASTTTVAVPGATRERAVVSYDAKGVHLHICQEQAGDPPFALNGHRFAAGDRDLAAGDRLEVGSLVAHYEVPSLSLMLCLQALASLSVAGFAVLVALRRGGTLADLGLKTDGALREAARGLAGYLAGLPLVLMAMVVSKVVCKALDEPFESHPLLKSLEADHSISTVVSIVLLAAVVAPICEEIIYRGFLTRALRRPFPSRIAAALIASFFFGAMHPGLASVLPISTVGAVFTAIFLTSRRGSLVGSIVAHACFNGLNIAVELALMRAAPA